MTMRDYAVAVGRFWKQSLVAFLAVLLIGGAYLLATPATYSATAQSFVSVANADSLSDLNQGSSFTEQVVKSYAQVATTPYVLQPVIDELRLQTTSARLARSVSVSAANDTVLLSITVESKTPATAAVIANSVSKHLQSAVLSLAPDAGGSTSSVRITSVQPATAPTSASSPDVVVTVLLAIVIGLLAAVATALGLKNLDLKVRTPLDVEQADPTLAQLGVIPFDPDAKSNPLTTETAVHPARAESTLVLRANLRFANLGRAAPSIVFTSSVQGEGKSTTVANLAIALAQSGEKVVLIDADLRRPVLASHFGIDGSIGLADILVGTASTDDAIQTWGSHGLRLIPAGATPPNPAELLQTAAMKTLLMNLESAGFTVLIDAPPLLPVADASVLAAQASGTVLVVGISKARIVDVRSSVDRLRQIGVRPLGSVTTLATGRLSSRYGYYA
jgi:capsular exopolysaccharide synthesis family protein